MKSKAELEEFHRFSEAQISAKIVALRKELIEFKKNQVLGKIRNVHEVKALKRRLARLLTILNMKVEARLQENAKQWEKQ